MISMKRVYEDAHAADGKRLLVERLWPRGVKKSALKLEGWLREVAPSTGLRKWFSHDPSKWTEFRRRYFAELHARPEAVQPLLDAGRQGKVTLIYSSHDEQHNNAVALKEYLEGRLSRMRQHRKRAA